MFNLIKLEIKKFKLQKNILGMVIAHLIVLCIYFGLQGILQAENESTETITLAATMLAGNIPRFTFVIFASILLSKLVISEYSNKTINVMFMYPISRTKIILSKLIIVVSVTFINILISNILVTSILAGAYKIFNIAPWGVAINDIVHNAPIMLLEAVLASFTALIPLFFGMRKKSVPATILSSILVCAIMYSSNGEITIQSILPIAILIAVVGLVIGIGVLGKVDKTDIV